MESYEPVLRAFADQNIKYLIVGGVAVNLHGYPRFTNDLDILLTLDQENLDKMADIMKRMGYQQRLPIAIQELSDERKARKLIEEKGLIAYSFIHDTYPQFNVDVLVAESIDFKKFSKHTMRAEMWGIDVPVVSIDDLIDMKKHSDREKDVQRKPRTSGFDRDQLRRMKYASVESKLNALSAMIEFTKEAQKSCEKRGVKYRPAFSE